MFHIQEMQSITIATAALCCFAAAGQSAVPNVNYTATGVFVTPALSGEDIFELAGEPFTLTFTLSEATKPTRHSETMAEYTNVPVSGTVVSGIDGATFPFNGPATLVLLVGTPGKPDGFLLQAQYNFGGDIIVITAKATMPPGTITTPAIKPFTAPVALMSGDTVTYACPACPPPWTGHITDLAIAGGTLSATKP
jgi:hypothetical protein